MFNILILCTAFLSLTSIYASKPAPVSRIRKNSPSETISAWLNVVGPMAYVPSKVDTYQQIFQNILDNNDQPITITPGTVLTQITLRDLHNAPAKENAPYNDCAQFGHPQLGYGFPCFLPLSLLEKPENRNSITFKVTNPDNTKVFTVQTECRQYDVYNTAKKPTHSFQEALAALKQRFAQEPKYLP